MIGMRPILLVEDNAADIELTMAALKRSNIANEIVVARDGVQALDYIFSEGAYADRDPEPPAVVLLDLKLPKVNGLEVLEKVKAHPEHRSIPIVMLTSSREETDVLQSYQSGVNSFVVKPVEFNAFFQAIRDLGMVWAVLNEPVPAKRP
ncbi:response regulator [Tianweitania sediminis]|uniref:Response regulator n=1 Tax=Tianweitania sediminis TaxID=1502156 RepID=A0A8J7UK74_9HYPH|nr:response regulator [Tianweitania sediminis]MBP0440838.1 response regulator [Tianweitania sediminis]